MQQTNQAHLYGEGALALPAKPEPMVFSTDFGHVFGQLICADLEFEFPVFLAKAYGIRHFWMPADWEGPSEDFLVPALAFFQSWF